MFQIVRMIFRATNYKPWPISRYALFIGSGGFSDVAPRFLNICSRAQ